MRRHTISVTLTTAHFASLVSRSHIFASILVSGEVLNKSSGKKILNTTFYPDQKGINKFFKGKSELKGNKQVKTKNIKLENAKNIVRMTKRLCDE